jgi:hypothetical protein
MVRFFWFRTGIAAMVLGTAGCGSAATIRAAQSPSRPAPTTVPETWIDDILGLDTTSDRGFRLMEAAVRECMAAKGMKYVARTPAQVRGEGIDPNSELIKGWPDEQVIAWSVALSGAADLRSQGDKGSGCTRDAVVSMTWVEAFPAYYDEVGSRAVAAKAPVPDLNAIARDVLRAHKAEVLAWYIAWPKLEVVS